MKNGKNEVKKKDEDEKWDDEVRKEGEMRQWRKEGKRNEIMKEARRENCRRQEEKMRWWREGRRNVGVWVDECKELSTKRWVERDEWKGIRKYPRGRCK